MISEEEVGRIAALAKLEIDDEERARMRRDLGAILALVDQIDDVGETEGQDSGRPQAAPTRSDSPLRSLSHDEVAANASQFLQGQFVVPRILGGE